MCNRIISVLKRRDLLLIVSSLVIIDQLTKLWILNTLTLGESIPVLDGFFNIVLVYNYGAAFGLFAGLEDGVRQIILTGTTIIAIGSVIVFLLADYYDDTPAIRAIALILGGAIGNIIDRARIGKVVDFLDFAIGSYHWPAFNVADSAICIGVTFLIIRSLIHKKATPPIPQA